MINIQKLLKGIIKMKGATKLFTDYTLRSEKGIVGRYNYECAVVSGYQMGDKFYFMIQVDSRTGRAKTQTTDLGELLAAMKAYAPKADDWKLLKNEGVK